ncbi:unnamed protein product, partial [Scytosiphon promiscuus]
TDTRATSLAPQARSYEDTPKRIGSGGRESPVVVMFRFRAASSPTACVAGRFKSVKCDMLFVATRARLATGKLSSQIDLTATGLPGKEAFESRG